MSIKQILACGLAVAALAFGALALTGCGEDNSAQVIKDGLTEQLEAPKNITDEFVAEIEASGFVAEIQTMEGLGISIKDFVTAMYDGYDYTIGEVTVDGDNASVPVTISIKDANAFVDSVLDLANDLPNRPEVLAMSEEEFLDWYADEIMRLLAETPVVTSDELTIELTCDSDGVWSPTAEAEALMVNPLG